MFDQAATGRFIAECRKEKGLTQRQLAERLLISDKTVSKWETGNGMPDSSMMQPLCEQLGINVNELLSAERLAESSYNGKAEENMVELIKENERAKGSKVGAIALTILGLLFTVLFIVGSAGMNNAAAYIDSPSAIGIAGFELLALGLAGRLRDVGCAFSLCFSRRKYDNTILDERMRAADAAHLAGRIAMIAGVIGFVFGFIMMLYYMSDPSAIGPAIAVAMLTLFYGFITAMIFTIMEGRLNR